MGTAEPRARPQERRPRAMANSLPKAPMIMCLRGRGKGWKDQVGCQVWGWGPNRSGQAQGQRAQVCCHLAADLINPFNRFPGNFHLCPVILAPFWRFCSCPGYFWLISGHSARLWPCGFAFSRFRPFSSPFKPFSGCFRLYLCFFFCYALAITAPFWGSRSVRVMKLSTVGLRRATLGPGQYLAAQNGRIHQPVTPRVIPDPRQIFRRIAFRSGLVGIIACYLISITHHKRLESFVGSLKYPIRPAFEQMLVNWLAAMAPKPPLGGAGIFSAHSTSPFVHL